MEKICQECGKINVFGPEHKYELKNGWKWKCQYCEYENPMTAIDTIVNLLGMVVVVVVVLLLVVWMTDTVLWLFNKPSIVPGW
jgi:hypothetical protein